ncbi:SIS domain-containing protein [Ferrovibrio sp.]|uniref:SIS domain-containing protein n=1 Tax=Ferrovibrio sp. TaxID=1917215 RepID=UPI003D2D9015
MESNVMFKDYAGRLASLLTSYDWKPVELLAWHFRECWRNGNQLFFCGNGGSAGNAIHLANDFVYGCTKGVCDTGIRVHALSANAATLTCLANDIGYDAVYSVQVRNYARPGDLLVVFSGSGNSPNIIEALKAARAIGVTTAAVLGYSGGQAKALADIPVHFPIDDMQISEDMQLVVGHMIMQWLQKAGPLENAIPKPN